MKKIIAIALFCFCERSIYAQQQGLFSNYLLHQVVYNPAYMGTVNGKQFNIGYRDQWSGFEGAPKTVAVSGYGQLRKKKNVTVGGIVFSEKIGLIDYTSVYGMFGYHLKINETAAINFAMGAGAVQYSVRMFGARPYDKDDYFLTSGVLNSLSFDANGGFYFYTPKFFIGFSNQHLPNSRIRWTNTQGNLTPHFYLNSGYNFFFGKKKDWTIQPSVLMRSNSPVPFSWEANLKTTYKNLVWISGNYRNKTSAGAAAGFVIDKQFSIAYAYDFALSEISAYTGGSHDILLSYLIPLSKKKSKSEMIRDADEEELQNINSSKEPVLKEKKEEAKEQKK